MALSSLYIHIYCIHIYIYYRQSTRNDINLAGMHYDRTSSMKIIIRSNRSANLSHDLTSIRKHTPAYSKRITNDGISVIDFSYFFGSANRLEPDQDLNRKLFIPSIAKDSDSQPVSHLSQPVNPNSSFGQCDMTNNNNIATKRYDQ